MRKLPMPLMMGDELMYTKLTVKLLIKQNTISICSLSQEKFFGLSALLFYFLVNPFLNEI
jgi:hypothetical protein